MNTVLEQYAHQGFVLIRITVLKCDSGEGNQLQTKCDQLLMSNV